MAIRDVGSAFLDSPDAFFLTGSSRVSYIELEKARRGVNPAFGVHQVRKDPHHSIGSRGRLERSLLHQHVRVLVQPLCLLQLELAERITEPPHGQAAVKANSLQHPLTRQGMTDRSKSTLRINQRLARSPPIPPHCPPPTANLSTLHP